MTRAVPAARVRHAEILQALERLFPSNVFLVARLADPNWPSALRRSAVASVRPSAAGMTLSLGHWGLRVYGEEHSGLLRRDG
jgi:hypothetical protein